MYTTMYYFSVKLLLVIHKQTLKEAIVKKKKKNYQHGAPNER